MANNVVLSPGISQNLLTMQQVADQRAMTQHRLATGKKVNSALDNPTNFFVAAGLSDRANDLSRILDSMGQGVKMLETANNGITALTRLIQTAQGQARQAIQAPQSTGVIRSSQSYTNASALVGGGGAFDAGDAVTIQVGAVGPVSITLTAGGGALDTMGELINAINNDVTLNPPGATPAVKASLDDSGKLAIEAVNGQSLTIGLTNAGGGAIANTLADLLGTGVTATEATGGSAVRNATINSARQSLATQFEDLKGQIDQLVKDSSFNGVNLLNGDTLKVLFNETNTTSLVISGVTFNSQGLGLAAGVSGVSTDTQNKWQSDTEINASLGKLDAALRTLRGQAASFGANLTVIQTRQDFTRQTVLTLNAGSDALTLADTNEEGANLLALQTRQQLSTTALSLSAQADQAVLRLFG
jgi:flagellin